MNKKILFIFVCLFLFSLTIVSADSIGTFKVNRKMQITNYCSTSDCTYANLSSIQLPDGTLSYLNAEMTQNGYDFNYSYTPTQIGTYTFKTCSNPEGDSLCESDTFDVTGDGLKSSLGFYILVFILAAGLIIWGYSAEDYTPIMMGSFVLVLFGLYILFYGLAGLKDTVYTWGIGIITLMVGGYLGIRAGLEQLS